MVADITLKNGSCPKYSKVVCVGVLANRPDELYIQTQARGKTKEIFIPLSSIHDYIVRDPY